MGLHVPAGVADRVERWADLSRWERSEVGRALRRLGWSYGEIGAVIPVPKGTLAGWCREIRLTDEQAEAIRRRTGSRKGVPRDTQRKRREEVAQIRAQARQRAEQLLRDPDWAVGTALYWGEGDKSKRMLAMTNSDPRLLRRFVAWVRDYIEPEARFVLSLHLHEGNDERAAKQFWTLALEMSKPEFYKTHVKPARAGHRTNRLRHGVCRVLMRRSTNAWVIAMEWIEFLADQGLATLRPGR